MDHKQLIALKRIYEQIEAKTIKSNIRYLMTRNRLSHNKLCDLLDISEHTAYSYTNKANKGKPILINLMIIAFYLGIDTRELLEEREQEKHYNRLDR